ncbi:MAG: cyclopropane fatty acyl phospholipid synthase [Candidatus Omnitrophica bacterium]|nr:cyclopropane fatty acyl phospholipid synthase [Candidatus Omnitrophota bacterium]MDE2222067.1 cyclopropane fatty acyl phospholipid synthase [Candidatus Omnitrophota bacterium]
MGSLKTFDRSLPLSGETQHLSWFDSASVVRQLLEQLDIIIDGNRAWDIQVLHPLFYKRVLTRGSLGLGESYMEGWWECEALDQLFAKLSRGLMEGRLKAPFYLSWWTARALLFNLQNKAHSFHNVRRHYDIGNDFYQAMLDKHMLYSCAYWKNAINLDDAQEAKLEQICQKLRLKPGMRILDVGCGWGGLVKYAAEHYGVRAVGITVSRHQYDWACKSCMDLPVEIRLQDYRDVQGEFDRIVSVGMFEHVGPKNYLTFMKAMHACLEAEGLFLLRTIAGHQSILCFDPWMDKYIFPGAVIPSIRQVGGAIEGLFIMEEWCNTGMDYDKTLMSWFANFNKNWYRFSRPYGEKFYRMWKYYLLSCAGLFRSRKQQLWTMLLSKPF